MTDQIAYQEYIQRRYNAFCKTVIRCAALDKILKQLALALASLYIDNTKPICYNIAKKNSHVVLISVSEVFIWQTAKTETSLLTALWAL